jgi:hypothetical protein
MNLIVLFETGEHRHLEYVLRSTHRYLVKNAVLGKPEDAIIKFLRKAVRFKTQIELHKALAGLKELLTPHCNTPGIAVYSLVEWIDSKLQKRELSEIIKEKYAECVAQELLEINAETIAAA